MHLQATYLFIIFFGKGDEDLILAPQNLFLQCLTAHSFSLLDTMFTKLWDGGGESFLNSVKSKKYLTNQESNDATAADDEY